MLKTVLGEYYKEIYIVNKIKKIDISLIEALYNSDKGSIVKGSIKMVDMYYRLVKAGLRTIQKVPDQFRDDVIMNLTSVKSEENGDIAIITSASNIIKHR